ncbi:MAG: YggS family pyridoxal phosphate-dependent enzyme, partial [Dehalococcoidia bacterium]
VKTAVEIFDIIHSIDSLRLAEALSGRARNTVPVLLQVNISGEEPKSGFSEAELPKAAEDVARLSMLKVKGLMTIAPLVSDPEEVRPIFRRLRELRDSLGLEHLSMGMSDDFEVAVGEGATMVRIGRAIFGEWG